MLRVVASRRAEKSLNPLVPDIDQDRHDSLPDGQRGPVLPVLWLLSSPSHSSEAMTLDASALAYFQL